MENIWPIEITIIAFLQSLGDWLIAPMQWISNLGSEMLFITLLPILMWCVDYGLGMRVGLILMASGNVFSTLKMTFHSPRPFWFSEIIQARSIETSFGMPSGHAMNTITVFGQTAVFLKKKWVSIVCWTLIALIGFSRVFLGMHFISDVLAGWLIGGLILYVFSRFAGKATGWFLRLPLWQQVLAALVSTGTWLVIGYLPYWANLGWQIPPEWVSNATHLTEAAMPHPYAISGLYTSAGVWLGIITGATWLHRRGGFSAAGDARQFLFRVVIGVAGTLIILMGLDKIFPDGESALALICRLVRYGLVGFWVSGLAPAIFIKANLAGKAKQSA